MSIRTKKNHPALKHGGYSAIGILPGESLADFEKLHRAVISELSPEGALEKDIVATLARLLWRKQNLATLRAAALARKRWEEIQDEKVPKPRYIPLDPQSYVNPAKYKEGMRVAAEQARQELGHTYELVEIGDTASPEQLLADLEVEERLGAMIDRCLKRLLFLRGLKSLASPSVPAPRISAPPLAVK